MIVATTYREARLDPSGLAAAWQEYALPDETKPCVEVPVVYDTIHVITRVTRR